ncbi:hypothetical protein BSNK01_26750 [Bacillaceae bacterium]
MRKADERVQKRAKERILSFLPMLGTRELQTVWHELDPVIRKQFLHEIFEHITVDSPLTNVKGGPGKRAPVEVVDFAFKA